MKLFVLDVYQYITKAHAFCSRLPFLNLCWKCEMGVVQKPRLSKSLVAKPTLKPGFTVDSNCVCIEKSQEHYAL